MCACLSMSVLFVCTNVCMYVWFCLNGHVYVRVHACVRACGCIYACLKPFLLVMRVDAHGNHGNSI